RRIQTVATGTEMIIARDNRGIHNAYSMTPAGRWDTADHQFRLGNVAWGDPGETEDVYEISFIPSSSDQTGCHKIRVKVDRRNSIVNYRDEYCDGMSAWDTLRGAAFGNSLERDLASVEQGKINLSVQSGVFRTDTNNSLVQIALKFPAESLIRKWRNDWTLHATIGILGVVFGADGFPVKRFSESACCDPDQGGVLDNHVSGTGILNIGEDWASIYLKRVEEVVIPTRFETQLNLDPGEYDLRIVLSDGQKFGRAEAHLNAPAYDGKTLALSSVMLCKRYRDAHVAAVERAAANFAPQYVPMVSKGMEVTPAGDLRFKEGEPLIPYFEIYEPRLASQPDTKVEARIKILDPKTGKVVKDFPPVDAAPYMNPGSTTIPVAREVPYKNLPKGTYKLEVQATDSAGRSTEIRSAEFSVE
ncbi:MAG: hypothetical protein ACM3NO_10590, partial [Deltaproteobacteria bacterium]